MPETEVILWSRLKGRQLAGCKFRRQYSVGPFVIDFFSPEVKLGIELDGDSHFEEGARAYDEKRTEFINSFGIRIMRFLNADVDENLDGVLEAIGQQCLSGALERCESAAGADPPWPPLLKGGKGGGCAPGARKRPSPAQAQGTRTPPKPRRTSPRSSPPPSISAILFPPLQKGGPGGVSPSGSRLQLPHNKHFPPL